MDDITKDEALQAIENQASQATSKDDLMQRVVKSLDSSFDYYSWTGFYLVDGEDLQVGPFVGKPTPHTRIKIGEGICGAAAASAETLIVEDVNADPRYLACSIETKSEIVVPLIDGGKVLGEIDIDSDKIAAFDKSDAVFLEKVAEIVVKRLREFEAQ